MTVINQKYNIEKKYRASQFKVYLSLNDKTFDVTNAVANLPAIKRQIENPVMGYGFAQGNRIEIQFSRDKLAEFLKVLPDTRTAFECLIYHKLAGITGEYKQFIGTSEDLPGDVINANTDKINISFITPFTSPDLDGTDFKDSITSDYYEGFYIGDAVNAIKLYFGIDGTFSFTAPASSSGFWSGIRKFRIQDISYGAGAVHTPLVSNTDAVMAMCSDGTYLYLGLNNFIVRYDPATRALDFITKSLDTTSRFIHLEYSAGDIYFVVNYGDALMGHGHFTVATAPLYVTIDYNKYKYIDGCRIDSKSVMLHNLRKGGDTDPAPCLWYTEMLGYGNPPPDKNVAFGRPGRGVQGIVTAYIRKGDTYCYIDESIYSVPGGTAASWENFTNWNAILHDPGSPGHLQLVGKILSVEKVSGGAKITFQRPADQDYLYALGATEFLMFHENYWPGENVYIPTFMEVSPVFENATSEYGIESVVVENRQYKEWTQGLYFRDWVAELGEGDSVLLPPGYYSMTASQSAEEFTNGLSQEEWLASPVCPWYLDLKWIDFKKQYLLADDLGVINSQPDTPYSICGPNKLWELSTGTPIRFTDGSQVESYDNIYLVKDTNLDIYIVMTTTIELRQRRFATIIIGKYNATTKLVSKVYQSRTPVNYGNISNYVIDSPPVMKNGTVYAGAKLYDRRWKKSGLKVIWAAPPQFATVTTISGYEIPSDYDGYPTVIVCVEGDKTDLLKEGMTIRLGDTANGTTLPQEYFISEINTRLVQFTTEYVTPEWSELNTRVTWMALKAVTPKCDWADAPSGYTAYEWAVEKEFLAKYIEISEGWDIRACLLKIDSGLTVLYTATANATTLPEGDEGDSETFYREVQTAELDRSTWPDAARITLDNTRVVAGSVAVRSKTITYTCTDKTSSESIPEPPLTEVYYDVNGGDNYDECILYLNKKLNNAELYIEYSYYLNASITGLIINNNILYFNVKSENYNLWKSYNFTAVSSSYSPAIKDTGLYSTPVAISDVIYAITEPSYMLRQFSTKWSGYIERLNTENMRLWDILGMIAGAANCSLYEYLGKFYIKPRTQNPVVTAPSLIASITKTLLAPFKKVEFSYLNGKYVTGEKKPVYSRSNSFVADYAHAKIIGDIIYDFYDNPITKYELQIFTYPDNYNLLDSIHFQYQGTTKVGYITNIEQYFNGCGALTLYENEVTR
jgi:hypothetical protein